MISTDNIEKYHDFLFALKSSLNIHELGEVRRFLGIEILKKNNGFYINQTDFYEKLSLAFKSLKLFLFNFRFWEKTKAVPKISFSKIRVLLGLSENSHNMGKYVKDVVQSIN